MNVFNRIIMVIGILALLALLAGMLILPLDIMQVTRGELTLFEENYTNWMFFNLFNAACVLSIIVLLVLLWLELRRPNRKMVRIKTTSGGDARLSIQSVAQSLEYRIDELTGVRRVQPRITSRGNDIEIHINLDTTPSVNVPALTEEIAELCHEIVEGQLGLRMHGKVRLNITHEPYPRGMLPQPAAARSAAVVSRAASSSEARPARPTSVADTQASAKPKETANAAIFPAESYDAGEDLSSDEPAPDEGSGAK